MMRPRSYLVGIAYCALLALGAILLSRKPVETFDGYMYAYIASGNDAAFRRLPELPPVYRAMSEASYQEQGPYYRVKPLFQMAVNLAARRVDAIRATHLVALGCFVLLGIAVWYWLVLAGISPSLGFVAALLLTFSQLVTDTARVGLPDMMVAALLLWGALFLFFGRKPLLGAGILVLAVFARTDAIVLGGILLLLGFWREKLSGRLFWFFSGVMLASYFLISAFGYSYFKFLAWTLREPYLHALATQWAQTSTGILFPYLLLGLLAWYVSKSSRDLVLAILAAAVIRYLLVPHLEARYYLAHAVMLGVLAVCALAPRAEHAMDPY